MIDLSPITDHWDDLLDGLRNTLWLSTATWVLSVLIGAGLTIARMRMAQKTLMRMSTVPRTGKTAMIVQAYVDIMRGMPSLVLILACFYLMPATGLRLNAMQSGLAALALYYGAYMTEVMRGAFASIPAGQWEAAIATGLAPATIVCRIILPQALGPMVPPLAGLTIGLFKETALLSTISVHELVFAGKEAISDSYAPFEIYTCIALVYWAGSAVIASVAGWIERRYNAHRAPQQPGLSA